MLDQLFRRFSQNDDTPSARDGRDLPRAVAALLIEAARADEEYTDEERRMIVHMLRQRFGITEADAVALREEAELAQAAAHDLYGFSRVVKDGLDREEKLRLLEDLWAIVLSDEESVPYEEMIIRRLLGLIHLEDRDSTVARQRAAERLARDRA